MSIYLNFDKIRMPSRCFFPLPYPQYRSVKAKIVMEVALTALMLFSLVFFIFKKRKPSMKICYEKESVLLTLPNEKTIIKMEKIKGGFFNHIYLGAIRTQSYILRMPKTQGSKAHFKLVLAVSKAAFQYGLAPQVIGENVQEQQMLLKYIHPTSWPSYEQNPEPYKATMRALRCFHEKMQSLIPKTNDSSFAPFTFIWKAGHSLTDMPLHFSQALEKIKRIFEQLKPWLVMHATLCHGDFHKGNVLLPKTKMLAPVLIDFDTVALGDPFFDVVKFSLFLPQDCRQELFKEYLGGRLPTPQEQRHFELIDLALLMVIACNRFKLSQDIHDSSQPRLKKEEIEKILDSKEPLPSFLKISFSDTSPKSKQLGATYALGEFLKRSIIV